MKLYEQREAFSRVERHKGRYKNHIVLIAGGSDEPFSKRNDWYYFTLESTKGGPSYNSLWGEGGKYLSVEEAKQAAMDYLNK